MAEIGFLEPMTIVENCVNYERPQLEEWNAQFCGSKGSFAAQDTFPRSWFLVYIHKKKEKWSSHVQPSKENKARGSCHESNENHSLEFVANPISPSEEFDCENETRQLEQQGQVIPELSSFILDCTLEMRTSVDRF